MGRVWPWGSRSACARCDLDPALLIGANMKVPANRGDGQTIRRVYDEATETR